MNFIEKNVWSDDEWNIFRNNLELLCKQHGMSKGEFNKKIGRWNVFRNVKTRPQIETIDAICKLFDVDYEWLSLPRLGAVISEPVNQYKPGGGYVPNAEASLGIVKGSEQWRAFAMLSKIYASEDQALIQAIYSNLCAFAESAERKRENAELKRDVEALQARLTEVVVQLDKKGIVHLDDRRSGSDRRVEPEPHGPDGKERRSGHDRRKAAPG